MKKGNMGSRREGERDKQRGKEREGKDDRRKRGRSPSESKGGKRLKTQPKGKFNFHS